MNDKPLVSVVTPVYNCAKYLPECIESVLNQTYKSLEYIIVDNCSTDGTNKIIADYQRKDNRIRVVENKNFLNLLENWNHSVRQISSNSKYCKIVHADDWLYNECIEKMVALAEQHPAIGIVSAYRLDENRVNLDGLPPDIDFLSGKDACRQFFLNRVFLFGSPSSLLFRSDLFRSRDPFYNEKNIHADQEVCFRILRDNDLGFVHQVLTYTRRHNEANTTMTKAFKTFLLGNLLVLYKYGKYYLNIKEFKKIEKKFLKIYYYELGKHFLSLRKKDNRFNSKEFFRYHEKYLKQIDKSLDWLCIFKFSIIVFYNSCLNKIKIK